MKGIVWHMETEGMTFDEIDVPADMQEEAEHWRAQLIEAVAEYDDKIIGKILRRSQHHHRRRSARSHPQSLYRPEHCADDVRVFFQKQRRANSIGCLYAGYLPFSPWILKLL
jgi:translation elongation factor EF-G